MRSMNCAVRAAVLVGICLFGIQAAATITLSNMSSDESAIAAANMSATVDFSVSGNTLTVNVSNASTDLLITEIYFNASSKVTNITLSSAPTNTNTGAMLWTASSSASTASFGTFDYVLTGITQGGGKNAQTGMILAGDSATFEFTYTGRKLTANDFGVEMTAMNAMGAGTFRTSAKGGTTAMGAQVAAVPEPTTAALMVMGLGLLARVGRSRNRE